MNKHEKKMYQMTLMGICDDLNDGQIELLKYKSLSFSLFLCWLRIW